MNITINIPETVSPQDQALAKVALQKIANSVTVHNLKFLAKLAEKTGINEKLADPLNRAGLMLKL